MNKRQESSNDLVIWRSDSTSTAKHRHLVMLYTFAHDSSHQNRHYPLNQSTQVVDHSKGILGDWDLYPPFLGDDYVLEFLEHGIDCRPKRIADEQV